MFGFFFLFLCAQAVLWHEEDFDHLSLETVNLFLEFYHFEWDIWNEANISDLCLAHIALTAAVVLNILSVKIQKFCRTTEEQEVQTEVLVVLFFGKGG